MNRQLAPRRPEGFTLVELLVAVTIMGILAAMMLGALQMARQSANIQTTQQTIAKLDSIIMERYASYLTRRVPITNPNRNPRVAAQQRLEAVWELMRLELPERPQDLNTASYPIRRLASIPPLARRYWRHIGSAITTPPNNTYWSAEFLYMIVMMGSPDAREHFREGEIGDADNDGFREFHDAWGNPIMFLRWAPGINSNPAIAYSAIQSGDATNDHSPLDPYNINPIAFRLLPLIYSAGPDGIYDVARAQGYYYDPAFNGDPYTYPSNAPSNAGQPNNAGLPVDSANVSATETGPADGELSHFDNIHNHFSGGP